MSKIRLRTMEELKRRKNFKKKRAIIRLRNLEKLKLSRKLPEERVSKENKLKCNNTNKIAQ